MPELPDVEVFKRLFDRDAVGQAIQQVIIKDARILGGVDQQQFVDEIAGRRFEQTRRHGKHLFAKLDNDGWLALHFGMSGGLSFFEALANEPPYTRVRFDFATGDHLAFTSRRMLGRLGLTADVTAFIQDRGLGLDALDPKLDMAAFTIALEGHRTTLKALLMNQSVIAGIGNIFADEILFQAGLDPSLSAQDLTPSERQSLFQSMKAVLETAVACHAGSEQFLERLPRDYLLPHRRRGGRCPRCRGLLAVAKIGGRSSYVCSHCQRRRD
jgi:formamidopyrimidine-DNA glycosylase